MKKLFLACPFLLATFAVLALYGHNIAELEPSDILIPLMAALGLVGLLIVISWLILRDMSKTLVIVSSGVVLFFSFGHAVNVIQSWGIGLLYIGYLLVGTPIRYLLIVWIIFFGTVVYLVIRTRKSLEKPLTILTLMAIALVAMPTVSILAFEVGDIFQDSRPQKEPKRAQVQLVTPEDYRDIYYIVLDRYGSESVLKEVYDFDNSAFTSWLSKRGFYVASQSSSNYLKTRSSLAASLNMQYINYLSEEVGEDSYNLSAIYNMLDNFVVQRLLKAEGYKYIHAGSWWEPTRKNTNADKNIEWHSMPEFSQLVFETTIVYPFYKFVGLTTERDQYERVLHKLDKLAEIPTMEEPTFVFAHFLIPHGPAVFDRDGNYLTPEEADKRSAELNYLDQVIFVNESLKVLMEQLLSKSKIAPIIILQSDEGPFPERYGADEIGFCWKEATVAELRMKTGILNAYYLPDVDISILYPSITPVNSFRLVFDLYFGTDYNLLPDKTYAFADELHPYSFFDITSKLR